MSHFGCFCIDQELPGVILYDFLTEFDIDVDVSRELARGTFREYSSESFREFTFMLRVMHLNLIC